MSNKVVALAELMTWIIKWILPVIFASVIVYFSERRILIRINSIDKRLNVIEDNSLIKQ